MSPSRDGHGGPGGQTARKTRTHLYPGLRRSSTPIRTGSGAISWRRQLAHAARERSRRRRRVSSHADLASHADWTDVGRWSGDPLGASCPSTSLGPWRRAHRSTRLGGHRSSFDDPVARWQRGACPSWSGSLPDHPFGLVCATVRRTRGSSRSRTHASRRRLDRSLLPCPRGGEHSRSRGRVFVDARTRRAAFLLTSPALCRTP